MLTQRPVLGTTSRQAQAHRDWAYSLNCGSKTTLCRFRYFKEANCDCAVGCRESRSTKCKKGGAAAPKSKGKTPSMQGH